MDVQDDTAKTDDVGGPAARFLRCIFRDGAAASRCMENRHLVVHNESQQRFEMALDGQVAFAAYRIDGNRMVFTHTEVPPPFRGQGIARKLVLAGLKVASDRNLQIVPLCSYVAHVLREHPEFRGPQGEEGP
jgi:predicted GNAT family acetyltransferase